MKGAILVNERYLEVLNKLRPIDDIFYENDIQRSSMC